MSTILLTKRDVWSRHAADLAGTLVPDLVWHAGTARDPLPATLADGITAIPCLISFLSPWIVPAEMLGRAALALNFHPASADYPGIGCYNFALYEGAPEYGAVVHHMAAKVDTGELVAERRFPVFGTDTVESLKLRTMVVMLSLFHDTLSTIVAGAPLPRASTRWTRRPFTRKELDELATIRPDMPAEEIARRVRATTYPGFPGPSITVGGQRFVAPVPDREPLA